MEQTVEKFLETLSRRGRVLLLGGLAIVVHGLSRTTKDADIWFEPCESILEWADSLLKAISSFPNAKFYDLRNQTNCKENSIVKIIARDNVIRIVGLDRPLDIFRIPHNLNIDDFKAIWDRSKMTLGTVRVLDEIDLLTTKDGTSRSQDVADISFLEDKIRKQLSKQLTTSSLKKASEILERYCDYEICKAALKNQNPEVRKLAKDNLVLLAESGDPFAAEILEELKTKK